MTIDPSKEHEIRRLHDVEKWKRGTIVAELGVHPDVVDRVLDRGAERSSVPVGDHREDVRVRDQPDLLGGGQDHRYALRDPLTGKKAHRWPASLP